MRPNIDIPHKTDGAIEDAAENRDQSKQDTYNDLLDHALDFRPLTDTAKQALTQHLNKTRFGGDDPEHAEHLVETGMTTLIKNYVSDMPGYRGDLILAIFGFPETYTLYTYENGEITGELDREAQKGNAQ
ncbi:hypothetical protein [Salinibaculum rarum]|uniref:hypothetical protein n=1 Tax=Salinibaculum rarum TaxID=3058903 RepID=UPI00265E63D4|nr:hypothetical protein [Salinibaculum sp. KK48]